MFIILQILIIPIRYHSPGIKALRLNNFFNVRFFTIQAKNGRITVKKNWVGASSGGICVRV